MSVDISTTAIQSFLSSMPESFSASAPPTNLPTTIPLAWPTDLHQLNFLTVLHLVYTKFTRPDHSAFFAEAGQRPTDVALRGALGLYLASDQGWDSGNFLATRAWRDGLLNEATVAEYFGIQILRERQHETMPITIGERYEPAVAVVTDLVNMFQSLGDSIEVGSIGEDVIALIKASKEHTDHEPEHASAFAKDFCRRAVGVMPSLADFYPDPPGDVLPAAPLRLLQDLAYAFGSNNPTIPLPEASALANVSPLLLPIAVLLHLGILQPEHLEGGDELRHATGDWWTGSKPDLFTPADKDAASKPPKVVKVSAKTLVALAQGSVKACSEITSHARFGDLDWQNALTTMAVSHIFAQLDETLDAHGQGVRLVLKQPADN